MIHVILVSPEIPPNTGNVIRLCANSGAQLHLVRPLGFPLDDARMRRAGLDYHEYASMRVHEDWPRCRATLSSEGVNRFFAVETGGTRTLYDEPLIAGDAFVFGCETKGLPAAVLADFAATQRLHLPMRPNNRSLNLSNAVAITVYEAWRQLGFAGAAQPIRP